MFLLLTLLLTHIDVGGPQRGGALHYPSRNIGTYAPYIRYMKIWRMPPAWLVSQASVSAYEGINKLMIHSPCGVEDICMRWHTLGTFRLPHLW